MNTVDRQFARILSRGWWLLLLRGIAAIAFGALAWFQPEISLATLVLFFGIYSMADGILSIWSAIAGRNEHDQWWLLLIEGLLGGGIGIMTFIVPELTTLALLFYIAIWAISTGVVQIVAAIRLRKEIEGEWLLILGGLASIAFGVLLMARPEAGALAVLWLIGSYAVFFGVILVLLAFKVRSFGKSLDRIERVGRQAVSGQSSLVAHTRLESGRRVDEASV